MSFAKTVVGKIEAVTKQRYPALRDPQHLLKVSKESLLFYSGDTHSQRGQDGILAEIFRRTGTTKGRFVEFGAWDGIYLSNCRYLFERGWSGVFIEADTNRYRTLCRNYGDAAACINAMVGTEPGSRLADLLGQRGIEAADIAFVSIDVDGTDLEILCNLGFKPPVVLMEGGFNFSPLLTREIPLDVAADNLGQPFAVICKRAKALGYAPVCFYQDTYFVREDLAAPFMNADASTLYADGYNFMPIGYRGSLIEMRDHSKEIRGIETEFFGHFHADPMAYADHDCLTKPSC